MSSCCKLQWAQRWMMLQTVTSITTDQITVHGGEDRHSSYYQSLRGDLTCSPTNLGLQFPWYLVTQVEMIDTSRVLLLHVSASLTWNIETHTFIVVLDVFIRFNDNLNGAQLDYGDHIKSQLLADIVLGLPRPLSESFHRHGMCTSKITLPPTAPGEKI